VAKKYRQEKVEMAGKEMRIKNKCTFKLTALAFAIQLASGTAFAGPEGGKVVGGAGNINRSGNNTVINQMTDRMAIDWQSYDVNINEKVRYIQPSSSSISLNRILSSRGSEIHGNISANGNVILVNTQGVMFGPNARIDVGGMVASGLDINSNDFMNGDYAFSALDDGTGKVLNSGVITAATGGSVTLLGKQVENQGLIVATLGTVNLASGKEAILSFDSEGWMGVRVTKEMLQEELGVDAAVINSGEITAESGRILLSGSVSEEVFSQAVNHGDVAKSIVISDEGIITLGSGSDVINTGSLNVSSANEEMNAGRIAVVAENITNSGTITANGRNGDIELVSADTTLVTENSIITSNGINGAGGTVKVLGSKVGVLDEATIDVSGDSGGGALNIGGGQTGENPWLPNADFVYASDSATLSADGLTHGSGGEIILFAENTARIYSNITAQGGLLSGNGGFIETSGLSSLDIGATPNAGARSLDGKSGIWLIDPSNIEINYDNTNNIVNGFFEPANDSSISVDKIAEALVEFNVTIRTKNGSGEGGSISLNNANLVMKDDYDANGHDRKTLTLEADKDISLDNGAIYADRNSSWETGSSQLGLNIIIKAGADGKYTQSNGADLVSGGGSISISGKELEINGAGSNTSIFNNISNQESTGLSDLTSGDGGAIDLNFTGSVKIVGGNGQSVRIGASGNDLTIKGESILFGNDGQEDAGTFLHVSGSSSTLALRASDVITLKDNILASDGAKIEISGLVNNNKEITDSLNALNLNLAYQNGNSRTQITDGDGGISLSADQMYFKQDTSIASNGIINLSGPIDGDGLVKITGRSIQGVGVNIETADGEYIDIDAVNGSVLLGNITARGSGSENDWGVSIASVNDISVGDILVVAPNLDRSGNGLSGGSLYLSGKNVVVGSLNADGGDGLIGLVGNVTGGNGGSVSVIGVNVSIGNILANGGFGAVSGSSAILQNGSAGKISITAPGTLILSGNINARPGENINQAGSGAVAEITLQGSSYTLAGNITIDTTAVNPDGTDGASGNAADIRFFGDVNSKAGEYNSLTVKANSIAFRNSSDLLVNIGQSEALGGLALNARAGIDIGKISTRGSSSMTGADVVLTAADAINTGAISTIALAPTEEGDGNVGGAITLQGTDITTGSLDASGSNAMGGSGASHNGGAAGTVKLTATGANTDYAIVIDGTIRSVGGAGVNGGSDAGVSTATITLSEATQNGSVYLGSNQQVEGSLAQFFEANIEVFGTDATTDEFYGPVFNSNFNQTLSWTINNANGTSRFLATETGPYVQLDNFGEVRASNVNDVFTVMGAGDVTTLNGAGGVNTLKGSAAPNTWAINDASGTDATAINTLNSVLTFDGMQKLQGGSSTDAFTVTGSLSGLTHIDGGGTEAGDSIDLTGGTDETVLVSVGGSVDNTALIINGIETLTGNSSANNTLATSGNVANTWNVSASDTGKLYYEATYNTDGSIASATDTLEFNDFQSLTGGGGNDQFSIAADAQLTGSITGGLGSNTLTANNNSTDNYNWILTEQQAGRLDYNETDGIGTENSGVYTAFTGIASITGTGTGAHVLAGRNLNTNWRIKGANSGTVAQRSNNGSDSTTDTLSFSGINTLKGGTANDWFIFNYTDATDRGLMNSVDGGGGSDSLEAYVGVINSWAMNANGTSGALSWQESETQSHLYTKFSDIENLTGGGSDQLDLSGVTADIAVTLGTRVVTADPNDVEFSANGFSHIIGNYHSTAVSPYNALFIVNDGSVNNNSTTHWLVNANNTGSITDSASQNVTFEDFNQLQGDAYKDTFTINNAASTIDIDGGTGVNSDTVTAATGSDNYWKIFADSNNNDVITGELSNGTTAPAATDPKITFINVEEVTGENNYADYFKINTLTNAMGFDGGDQANPGDPEIIDTADFSGVTGAVDIALASQSNNTAWVDNAERLIGNGTGSSLTGGNGNDTFTVFDVDGATGTAADGTNDGTVRLGGTEKTEFINFATLNGGHGSDTFIVQSGATASGALNGYSLDQANQPIDDNAKDTFTINGTVSGTINAGGGNDEITLASNGTISGTVNAGAGSDQFTLNGRVTDTATLNGEGNADTFNINAGSTITGTIDGGAGGDIFAIAASVTNTLLGGSGNDQFRITSDQLSVTIDGGDNADTLELQHDQNTTWTLADTHQVTWTDTATTPKQQSVGFSNIETARGSEGEDTFNVSNKQTLSTLEGREGNDVFNIDAGIALTLYGGIGPRDQTPAQDSGTDTLALTGSPSGVAYWGLDGSPYVRSRQNESDAYASIDFFGVEKLIGGTGNDYFEHFNAITGITQIEGNAGADEFVVTAGRTLTLYGGLIDGTQAADNDQLQLVGSSAQTWSITDSARTAIVAGGTVTFSQIDEIQTGSGDDQITLTGGGVTKLSGGDGGDDFTVASGLPATLYAGTEFTDPDSDDTLTLTGASTDSASWTLGQTTSVTSKAQTLTFYGIDSVEGMAGKDTFSVTSNTINNLYGGDGNDVFKINTGLALNLFGGTETQDTGTNDSVQLIGSGNAAWVLNGNASYVTSNGQRTNFQSIESVTGGTGGDSFSVYTAMNSIDGGNAQDETAYNTLIDQTGTGHTWTISEKNGGSITGLVTTFARIENLTGSSQADTFVFTGTNIVDGLIDGSTPTNTATGDTLDLQAFTGNYAIDYSNSSNSVAAINFKISDIENILHGETTGQTRTLVGDNAGWDWYIVGTDTVRIGSATGPLIEGFNTLHGGAGTDRFFFSSSGTLTGDIYGGQAGNDSITGPTLTTDTTIDWVITQNTANASGNGHVGLLGNDIQFSDIEQLNGGNSADRFTVNGISTISISGNGGIDEFLINHQLQGALSGGAGADVFTLAAPVVGSTQGSLGNISGGAGNDSFTVTTATADFKLVGNGDTDTLTLDYAPGANWVLRDNNQTPTVTETNTADNRDYTITFDEFEILNGSNANDTLTINDTYSGMTFNGRNGVDTVTNNVRAETTWTINETEGSSVVGGGVNIILSTVEKLVGTDLKDIFNIESPLHSIDSCDGNDELNISANITDGNATTIDVQTGDDNDTINVDLAGIAFSLDGGNGTNTLVANDDNATTIWNWIIDTASSLTNGAGTIGFANIANLTGAQGSDTFTINTGVIGLIDGRGSNDTFNIAATVAGGIQGGAGDDTFNLNDSDLNISLQGGASETTGDKLVSSLSGDIRWRLSRATGSLATVTTEPNGNQTTTRHAGFIGIESFVGSTANDHFEITQDGTTATISGGAIGEDTLTVTDGNSMGTIWSVADTNILTYKNTAYSTAIVSFDGIEILQGSNASDLFTINNSVQRVEGLGGDDDFAVSATITDNLYGGDGNDTITLAASDFPLTVYGGEGTNGSEGNWFDTLIGDNTDHAWHITRSNGGYIDSDTKIQMYGIDTMTGGTANDIFYLGENGNYLLRGVIDGGDHRQQDVEKNVYGDVIDATALNGNYTFVLQDMPLLGQIAFTAIERVQAPSTGKQTINSGNGSNTWEFEKQHITLTDNDSKTLTYLTNFTDYIGGSGVDQFRMGDIEQSTLNGFSISGGAGDDLIDYSLVTEDRTIYVSSGTGDSGIDSIEGIIGYSDDVPVADRPRRILVGVKKENDRTDSWEIKDVDGTISASDGINDGTYTYFSQDKNSNQTFTFINFDTLIAGDAVEDYNGQVIDDNFQFGAGGKITGGIDGGLGNNTITTTGSSQNQQFVLASQQIDIDGGFENLRTELVNISEIKANQNTAVENTLYARNQINTWDITGTNVGSVDNTSFSGIRHLVGGDNADTFNFQAQGQLTGLLDGGANTTGTDSVNLINRNGDMIVAIGNDLPDTIQTDLKITHVEEVNADSTNKTNTLIGSSGDNKWTFNGENNGQVIFTPENEITTTVTFTGFDNVTGRDGKDAFTFTGSDHLTGIIQGGGGDDSLTLTDVTDRDTDNQTRVAIIENGSTAPISNADFSIHSIETITGSTLTGNTLQARNTENTWLISDTNTGTLNTNLTFVNFSSLIGGTAKDSFEFQNLNGTQGEITGLIDGGTAPTGSVIDELNMRQLDVVDISLADIGNAVKNVELLIGNNRQSTLRAANQTNTWTLSSGENDGQLNTDIRFEDFNYLVGNDGTDNFIVTGGSVTGGIDSGAGNDVIAITLAQNADGGVIISGGDHEEQGDTLTVESIGSGYDTQYAPQDNGYAQLYYSNGTNSYNVSFTQIENVNDWVQSNALTVKGTDAAETFRLSNNQVQVGDFERLQFANKNNLNITTGVTDTIQLHGTIRVPAQIALAYGRVESASPDAELVSNRIVFNDTVSIGTEADKVHINTRTLALDGIQGESWLVNNNQQDTQIASLTSEGFVHLESQGAITANNAIQADNGIDFIAHSGDIKLENNNNRLNGTVSLDAGNHSISLTHQGTTELGNLTANAATLRGETMEGTGSITIADELELDLTGDAIFNTPSNRIDGLRVTNANSVSVTNADAISINQFDGQTLDVQANGITVASMINTDTLTLEGGSGDIAFNQSVTTQTALTANTQGHIQQNNTLTSNGLLTLNAGGELRMSNNASTQVENGTASYTANGEITLNRLQANTIEVTSHNANIEGIGNYQDIQAERLVLKAQNGIGGDNSDNALKTSVNRLRANSQTGNVYIFNEKGITVEQLRNNGFIYLNVDEGDITLDNTTDNSYDFNEPDANLAGGVSNTNFNSGDILLMALHGNIWKEGTSYINQPDIVGNNVELIVNPIRGQAGKPDQPLIIYANNSLTGRGMRLNRIRAGVPTPKHFSFEGLDFDPSTLINLGAEQMVEVEESIDIDPAIFTAVTNYVYDEISIRLPRDQMYEDELDEYDRY